MNNRTSGLSTHSEVMAILREVKAVPGWSVDYNRDAMTLMVRDTEKAIVYRGIRKGQLGHWIVSWDASIFSADNDEDCDYVEEGYDNV